MAEKIVSPGVFTNEIDQSFIPAALGEIGAAIVGPTVKGPVLEPTVVSSYGEYVNIFGEMIESGSDKYQYLTSHTAQEYLRQGGPLTIVRVADPTAARATANIFSGSSNTTLFTIEALGDGPQFNNFVGTGSNFGNDGLLPVRAHDPASNNHFGSGSFGGRADNIRYEISQRNVEKGTFTLVIRQGNDNNKRKIILETHANLSFDPESADYILKRIGNQTNTIATEDGIAYLQPTGDYPNMSKFIRVSNLPESTKTPNYLDNDGVVTAAYANSQSLFPLIGSGSFGGAFGTALPIGTGTDAGSGQTAGDFGGQIEHPFQFYDDINTNTQGIDISVSANTIGTGGYATALSLLANKDEYEFNLLFLPGVIDGITDHGTVISRAIDVCESRGDCFLVYDATSKTDTITSVTTTTKTRNSSFAATYYPWVQVQDSALGTLRYVPPSVVIAGVYHFNDVVGQPWFAPAGLNRGGIDTAIRAYRKLTQKNRDDLYDSNVNPIATFPGQGVTVFGQKTTQKKASALDRVNVRRLLINIKSFIARSSRNLVFEQNTGALRDQFLNIVNPFLDQVQSNSGLNAFRVVMDDTNNTPETIDRNQLIGQVFIQPTRTAEFIVLDFIVQPSGAAFPE